jgi:hypothetical protein
MLFAKNVKSHGTLHNIFFLNLDITKRKPNTNPPAQPVVGLWMNIFIYAQASQTIVKFTHAYDSAKVEK